MPLVAIKLELDRSPEEVIRKLGWAIERLSIVYRLLQDSASASQVFTSVQSCVHALGKPVLKTNNTIITMCVLVSMMTNILTMAMIVIIFVISCIASIILIIIIIIIITIISIIIVIMCVLTMYCRPRPRPRARGRPRRTTSAGGDI